SVSPSNPSGGIRCNQTSLHLHLGEKLDGCPHVALGRNRKYPLAIERVGWLAEGHVAEEGMKGCQSRVPGANGIAALVFEVVEERSQKSLVEFLHTEIRGVPAELLRCEAQEQAEGISVARHSMRSEEHTSELQSRGHLVCRLLLEKKKT